MSNQIDNWRKFSLAVKGYIAKHGNEAHTRADLFTCFAYNNKQRPKRVMRYYVKMAYIVMQLYMQLEGDNEHGHGTV